jgi:hypothetical protein
MSVYIVSGLLTGHFEYGTGVNVRILWGEWNFGGFEIAALNPKDTLVAGSSTEVSMPGFEANYNMVLDNFSFNLGAGYGWAEGEQLNDLTLTQVDNEVQSYDVQSKITLAPGFFINGHFFSILSASDASLLIMAFQTSLVSLEK